MPLPNALWPGVFQGRELKKYCYIRYLMKHLHLSLSIPLGIMVNALAFHARDRGSIPCLGNASK